MSRKHLKGWPECLHGKSLDELRELIRMFQRNATRWPNVRKSAEKSIRLVEKEISRRDHPPDAP